MWLKVITTIAIVFSISMLLAYVWIVGPKPPVTAPRAEQIAFLRRGALFVGVEAIALIVSIVGSFFIARQARKEYREMSQKNMEALLEATLRDHAKSQESDAQPNQ